ncbi:coiled-coil domain-containing protein 94-like [Stylophora pistillata]|uniref:Splicing factor YJU2 n=1 Tax=Stylophora pistillata TaxID=50429 RepID=A0A2B4ST32_STYPI|nr:coiled-coil domain-containing protein 94-like [Stylophora pistillata]PFX31555.1 Coiled-coil domain-containing protein 94 [Stylophora pistillata]
MSERKVLNKYYPPDFDASKIPKLGLSRDRQYVVRLMAPFNMRCTTCGEYIYKGKKFNARKETVQNDTYLGLLKFRFYIRCPRCISEITFKTDPENTDYVCENGATRNFQAQKLMEDEENRKQKEEEEEEQNNPMKALEKRTKESKQEMDILEKLEELRDLNTRLANVDYDTLLELNAKAAEEMRAKEEEEDEQLVQSIFGNQNIQRRLEDVSDGDEEEGEQKSTGKIEKRKATDILAEDVSNTSQPAQKKQKTLSNVGIGKLKNKSLLSSLVKVNKDKAKEQKVPGKAAVKPGTACSEQKDVIQNSHKDTVKIDDVNKAGTNGSSLGLLGNYSSSSEDSDH